MNAAIAMKFEMMELGDYVVEMKNIIEKWREANPYRRKEAVALTINYICVIYSVVNNKVNNNAPLTEIERKSLTDIKHKVLEHRKLV